MEIDITAIQKILTDAIKEHRIESSETSTEALVCLITADIYRKLSKATPSPRPNRRAEAGGTV